MKLKITKEQIKAVVKAIGNLFKDPRKRLKRAVQITQFLKKAIDSKVGHIFVDVFPGEWDNVLRDKLSKRLAEALYALQLIDNLTYIPIKLQNALNGPDRTKWLTAIAAELAHRDLGIDYDSAEAQTQLIYITDPDFQADAIVS